MLQAADTEAGVVLLDDGLQLLGGEAACRLGINERQFRRYLLAPGRSTLRECPYIVQYAFRVLGKKNVTGAASRAMLSPIPGDLPRSRAKEMQQTLPERPDWLRMALRVGLPCPLCGRTHKKAA